MKVSLSRDGGIDFSAGPEDAELARSVADAAEGLLDLADAAGLAPGKEPCENCGKMAHLRPVATMDRETGEVGRMGVCAECQEALNEQRLDAARQGDVPVPEGGDE